MDRNRRERFPTARFAAIATAIALSAAVPLLAAEPGAWTLRVEPLFVEAYGHDRNVLDVRRGSSAERVEATTDSGPGYHVELRRRPGSRWGWGVDFFWFSSPQSLTDRGGTGGGAGDPLAFELPGGAYVSTGPGETLYYRLLEDNDIAAWTLDLYATKRLVESERRSVDLLVGARTADFDNDYRAVVGIADATGTRFDSSSNYGRMHGPIVGWVSSWHRGATAWEVYASQSVVFGSTELTGTQSDFVGPFIGEAQEFVEVRTFSRPKDVTIPITELQITWIRALGARTAVHLGLGATAWTDVPVPPGVIPSGGPQGQEENTIVFAGLLAGLEVQF